MCGVYSTFNLSRKTPSKRLRECTLKGSFVDYKQLVILSVGIIVIALLKGNNAALFHHNLSAEARSIFRLDIHDIATWRKGGKDGIVF